MRIGIILIAMIAIAIIFSFFLTDYRSAFEADQACHVKKRENYNETPEFGCDHDLETRQWLLYQEGTNHQPAKVIQRFRY